jgi:hypothetical protein
MASGIRIQPLNCGRFKEKSSSKCLKDIPVGQVNGFQRDEIFLFPEEGTVLSVWSVPEGIAGNVTKHADNVYLSFWSCQRSPDIQEVMMKPSGFGHCRSEKSQNSYGIQIMSILCS